MKIYFRKEVPVIETRRYSLSEKDIESLGVTLEFFLGLDPEQQEELLAGGLANLSYEIEDIHER